MRSGLKITLALSALVAWNAAFAQSTDPARKPAAHEPTQIAQAPQAAPPAAGAAGGAAAGAAAGTAGVAAGIGAGTMAAAFGAAVAAMAVAGAGGQTVSHFAVTHNPSR